MIMNTERSSTGKAAASGVATTAYAKPFTNTGRKQGGTMKPAMATTTVNYSMQDCRKWLAEKMSRNNPMARLTIDWEASPLTDRAGDYDRNII